jgi:hypothetical protein
VRLLRNKPKTLFSMLSPSKFSKAKFESIIGELGKDLLKPQNYEVVKRGANVSPKPKDLTPKTIIPVKGEEDDDDDPSKPRTMTMKCGMIKFQDIIIPPSAPTDLICEECEVKISVLCCRRCRQVFCMKCAEACHPKAYGTDYHPHEVDGHIRPVEFGDTSRIKITNEFVMPDIALSEEDYMKVKDLTKPQSLSTSVVPAKPTQTTFLAPKYDVQQVVLFIDPHTEQEAYGSIISEWDQRHGTMATPAILRGDGSVVYYMVQMLGFTKHVVNIANLIPPTSTVTKIENYAVIEGVELDGMVEHRKGAHIIQKRIAEAEAIKRLGPKHHLRDVVNYGAEKDTILLDNREHGLNSAKPKHSGLQLLNSAIYNNNTDDMSECVTIASSTASQRQLIANKHRRLRMGTNNEYVITPVEYGTRLYDGVDLNVYADVDTDVHSQLSMDNPLAHPFPASHRSYQHLLHANRVDSNMSINTASQGGHDDNHSVGSQSQASGVQPVRKKLNMGAALKDAAKRTGKYINNEKYDTHNIYQSDDHRMLENSLNSQSMGHRSGAGHSQHSGGSGAVVADEYTRKALQVRF